MGAFGGKSKKPKPEKGADPPEEAEVGGAWATKTTWADAAEKPADANGVKESPTKKPPPPGQEDEPDEECEVIDVGKAVSPQSLRPDARGPGDPGHDAAPPHVYSQANVQEAPVIDVGPEPVPQPVLPAEQQKAADRLAKQRQEMEARKGSDPFGELSGSGGAVVMPTFGGLEDLEEAILRDGLATGLQDAQKVPSGVAAPNGSNGPSKKFDESDEELMDTILNEITAVT